MKTNKLNIAVRAALIGAAFAGSNAIASNGNIQLASPTISGINNGTSRSASLSADGRYVAFQSTASNLAASDTDTIQDIFVFDRQTGGVELISVSTSGVKSNGTSYRPSISADGRYVVFTSLGNNLVAGDITDTNSVNDVFVRDRITGTTVPVSLKIDAAGKQTLIGSTDGIISADGRYIGFNTLHSFDSVDTNHTYDIYRKDMLIGTTLLVSRTAAGNANHTGVGPVPAMSGDGTVFAWYSSSYAFDPLRDYQYNGDDVFVRDLKTNTTRLVSIGANNKGAGNSQLPSLNHDGTKLIFSTNSSLVVPGDTNGRLDVFAVDLTTYSITRVSLSETGAQLALDSNPSPRMSLSADGRYVAFQTTSPDVVAGDSNGSFDVFVRDLENGVTTIVSKTESGDFANGHSLEPAISADGRYVGFGSLATNLTSDAVSSSFFNVYLVDRITNQEPFAFAGYDQLVEATAINTPVTLDASGSSDPDEDALTYTWSGGFGLATGVGPVVALGLGTHDINLSVDDGNGGFASDQVQIIVQDTTPPALSLPADIEVVAQGLETTVTLGAASADDIFGPVELTNNAPAVFPIGETIVTYTATDANGNVSTAEQKVVVKYDFAGFEGPVTNGGVYKQGRTIPVKFKLYYADGTLALSATARIYAQRIENDVAVGDPIDLQATNGADSGNIFRIVGDSYMFNMDTSFASTGTYQILVDMGDGTALKAMEIGFK